MAIFRSAEFRQAEREAAALAQTQREEVAAQEAATAALAVGYQKQQAALIKELQDELNAQVPLSEEDTLYHQEEEDELAQAHQEQLVALAQTHRQQLAALAQAQLDEKVALGKAQREEIDDKEADVIATLLREYDEIEAALAQEYQENVAALELDAAALAQRHQEELAALGRAHQERTAAAALARKEELDKDLQEHRPKRRKE